MSLPPPYVEVHKVQDREVFVFDDGLCSPFPGPNNSKVRGVFRKLAALREQGVTSVASQDTRISRCGWGVSFAAKQMGMKHYNFYPRQSLGVPLPFYQRMSQYLGAEVIPIRGNHSSVMHIQAQRYLNEHNIDAYYLPVGLSMTESVLENSEVIQNEEATRAMFEGSLVACVSSGTILSGLLLGLAEARCNIRVYGVLASSFKHREDAMILKMRVAAGKRADVQFHYPKRTSSTLGSTFGGRDERGVTVEIVDPGYDYHESIQDPPPFPCDVYLDRKAWEFLKANLDRLADPIVFWNVGGEWDPIEGLKGDLRGDGLVTKEKVEKILK